MSDFPTSIRGITGSVEAIGGSIKVEPIDFVVEEIASYEPCGEGEHIYLWVEKRDVAHKDLVRRIANHLGVDERAVGYAGMKDRRAVTRQWLSVHRHDGDPQEWVGAVDDGVDVLAASRHQNKLRAGHSRGNRFEIRVRNPADSADVERRLTEKLAILEARGIPNYFGTQRFGRNEDTLRLGLALVRGERPPQLRKSKWLRKLAASAVQSAVFNRVLDRRIAEDTAWSALDGDRLNRVGERGQLVVTEETRAEAEAGLRSGELVVTGPMPGPKMYETFEAARAIEEEAAGEFGLSLQNFDMLGKTAPGTRRDFFVTFVDPPWFEVEGSDAVRVGFSLPSGAYATIVLAELISWDFSAWEAT